MPFREDQLAQRVVKPKTNLGPGFWPVTALIVVLSAVMVDPGAFDKVNEFLRPEHFYSEAHRRIYEGAVELSATGKPVDVVQVATWLRDHERLAQAGGVAYLTEVLNAAPAVANVA